MPLVLKSLLNNNIQYLLRRGFLFIGLCFMLSSAYAQTEEYGLSFGLHGVKNEYNGDLGSGLLHFSQPWYPAVGLSITTYISRTIDFGLQGSFGKYGYYKNAAEQFAGLKYDGSLFLHYKLNNGRILRVDSKFSPFFTIGFGFASYTIDPLLDPTIKINTVGVDFIMPFGIGVKYQVFNAISIQYQYLYNKTNMDNHDGVNGQTGNGTSGSDAYGQHILGIIYVFKMPKVFKCRCEYN
jgi:opacity protein-like surface antigen